ncbi:MAG: TAXI family TRAP transporter solute-binding subunit [Desulfobacterales bacterium]|nr:TAXI family TRAP transporter solute-binding subunit [Desulfobacterales bacterium]
MKKWFFLSAALLLTLSVGCSQPAEETSATKEKKTTFITIGTGGITGVYYPTGGAIARIVNKKREEYGIRATVESTGGSVFNVNAIMAGDLEFGIVQSDRQFQAVNGLKEWEYKPQKDLRAVFSIHPESVTLLAAVDSGIKSISDLKGKRVNIGNPGSGQRGNAIDALEAAGISWQKDLKAESVKAAEAPGLLQDERIDAFFYTVGHPSGAFKEATSGRRKTQFVSITETDALVQKYPYYAKSYIPKGLYPGATNTQDTPTFGVKATFCTSAKVSDQVVYAMVKEIFENFEEFKKLHPAYQVLTKKSMLEGLSAPIHPGAMMYYKEAGLMK